MQSAQDYPSKGNRCYLISNRFCLLDLQSNCFMGVWAFLDAQCRDYIILFVKYLFSLCVQCRWDISFCYTELPGWCINDFKTRRLSSSAWFCCEFHLLVFCPVVGVFKWNIKKFLCQLVFCWSSVCLLSKSKSYIDGTFFVQDGAAIWCIGWQKIQGQGITILGGLDADLYLFFIKFTSIPFKNAVVTKKPHAYMECT